jgi:hypothetical protein
VRLNKPREANKQDKQVATEGEGKLEVNQQSGADYKV